ncbi:MAG: riboflavin synthase [Chromatiales bacterium]|jgi:riboflavin synthase|nr:riboflavin synthase [Chromatiales bacterium]
MFTGIVQAVGRVVGLDHVGGDVRLRIDAAGLAVEGFGLGDSVSVNGVCLTVAAIDGAQLAFDVSAESLSLSTLGTLTVEGRVNLEPAATPSTALGGHIVSGHVDAVARVASRRADGRSVRFDVEVPQPFTRYLAPKGSITLDGVSLTVNGVAGTQFDINIVPHTLENTIIDSYQPGTHVNLEIDVVARYVERLLESRDTKKAST